LSAAGRFEAGAALLAGADALLAGADALLAGAGALLAADRFGLGDSGSLAVSLTRFGMGL
jgi:hypothetical protein